MFVAFQSGNDIKASIQQPMKNEKQFKLLEEMNAFVTYQPFSLTLEITDPNEEKEGETRIMTKNFLTSTDDDWKHKRV